MGAPLSNYTLLQALSYPDALYSTGAALEALRPFNLFAFIIHDPEAHPDFDKQLNHLFDKLDYVTGDKLLFFALVNPPTEWLTHARYRNYYKQLTSLTEELLDPEQAIVSSDSGITAFSLANSLGIPNEVLPCIVITPDFRLERFLWFRTCTAHISEQLTGLGYIAKRLKHSSIADPNDLFELIRQEDIDLCHGNGAEAMQSSLAKALSDLLSFIIAGNNSDSHLQSIALEQAQRTLSELYATLNKLKGTFDENDTENFDRLCINIISFLSHLNNKNLGLDDFIPINRTFLESDSYKILKTAHKVFNLLMSRQLDKIMSDLQESFDHTPGVICLAKVFEKEINLSVVHWIRKELGISLPPYFNKPQPHVEAIFVPRIPRGREIDFNMNRHGKWLPPGIGQSEIACKEISKTKMPLGWDNLSWNLLLTYWKEVREERNEAAHTELVDEHSLLVVKNALEELSKRQIFQYLYLMKREYRGYL